MSNAQQVIATVIFQQEIAPRYYRLGLQSQIIARTAQAGQFVHILPRLRPVNDPLLRRAFSVARVSEEYFEIVYRISGRGTAAMSLWQPGQTVDVLGPLGRPFAPLALYSLLVGGGVGVPPLAMLAAQRRTEQVRVLLGARTTNDVVCREDFERVGVPLEVATEDGSEGEPGLVTSLLQKHLDDAARKAQPVTIYSCGPLPMLRAVAAICRQVNVPCQVSLEENMPCGVGICNGCVVPVSGAGDEYGRYRRICVDGPVLWAQEIDWSHWEPIPCP